MAVTVTQHKGSDLAPACDRCGHKVSERGGAVIVKKSLAVVCLTCLSDVERTRLARAVAPFQEDG